MKPSKLIAEKIDFLIISISFYRKEAKRDLTPSAPLITITD